MENIFSGNHRFPPAHDFSSLCVKDLLDAREAYHLHLAHLENVVATAIGRFRIRKKDRDVDDPDAREKSGNAASRTLENTVVKPWSWPCVMVFVDKWEHLDAFHNDPNQVVPKYLYLPDGRVVPTCVIQIREQELIPQTSPNWIFPNGLIGGGYPVLTTVQGREHISSLACLVTDGEKTFALSNRHVTGPKGQRIYTLMEGQRQRVGISAGKDVGKRPFDAIYPGWPGAQTLVNLDAGLIEIDNVHNWRTQVYGIGELAEPVDLNTDTITLDMLGCPVRAFGCASGQMSGQIVGLFYRYKTVGGKDYTADLLIGPREGCEPLKTAPGDSATLWFFDPPEEKARGQEIKAAEIRRLRPIALQWGGHALVGSDDRTFPLALATFISTICRELDIEVVRGWNITNREYWGKTGHYKVAARACDLISDPKLKNLMAANRDNIAFSDEVIGTGKDFKVDAKIFVPLADVPDYIWVTRRRQGNEICFYDHFADMDEEGKGEFAGKTLFNLCEDEKNVDVRFWNRFYDSLDKKPTDRGKLPFRVWQVYEEMVRFLQERKITEFLCAAGVLAHYVADGSQPLHISYLSHGDPDNPTNVHKIVDQAILEQNVAEFLNKLNQETEGKIVQQGDLIKGGYKAALAVLELMRRTVKTLPPRRVVDVFEDVQGRGQAKSLWQELSKETIAVMADGCNCLAMIWESAWREGKGSEQFNKDDLGEVSREDLKKLYLSRDFLPDYSLEELAAQGAATSVGFAPPGHRAQTAGHASRRPGK